MKSVIFSFATHNHQPIGNFDHIFEESYRKSYLPFIELAERFPKVRFATHFTGILLEWIEANYPEHITRIKGMVERGQLEMISGGYYEPILSVFSEEDRQAQITMLSDKIRELFQTDPTGFWLAERVWEQPLASTLANAGIKYVLLDDTHFLYAGLSDQDLTGYYMTEDSGQTIAAFPISKPLRYAIPFQNVDETIRILGDAASESGDRIVTFADDGEKFGVWPETYKHVYEDGWLEEFFAKLSENADWISFLPPGEALTKVKPRGRIYLPNASYAEMMQWSLPTAEANARYDQFIHDLDDDKAHWDQYRSFVRGGYWRNFFTKYPEANQLHKHVLRTSERILMLAKKKKKVEDARKELLKAQCNDPYWHGVFGGIYLSNLRHANFSALVRADRLADEAEKTKGIRMEAVDFDADGEDEVILETPALSIFVHPSVGGMISEIDFKPRAFNATNILARRKEAYHDKISQARHGDNSHAASIHEGLKAKEAGLEHLLTYDWYRRGSMIEHFTWADSQPDWQRGFEELGDFVMSAFEWSWNKTKRVLTLSRKGNVLGKPISMTKEISINRDLNAFEVQYLLTNESEETLRFQFASEWAFHLLAPDAPDRYYESDGTKLSSPAMNSSGTIEATNIRLVDEYLRVAIGIAAKDAHHIVRYPLETVSMSEGGFERVFQGSVVLPAWELELNPRASWNGSLQVSFDALA